MGWSKTISLLVDNSHNNLVNPRAPCFSSFFKLLKSKGFDVSLSDPNTKLTYETLESHRSLIIGVPQNKFFMQKEIHAILQFIRNGGSLLVLHRYGGDVLQKTNLNELTTHFGIYFENNLLKDLNNVGLETLPIINNFHQNLITDGINKVVFPGTCSIRTAKDAQPICYSGKKSWIEVYNLSIGNWIKDNSYSELVTAAYSIYGQGRVIVVGTSDFLAKAKDFGLSSLDNRNFCLNILNWLTRPVSDMETRDWMIQQIGVYSEDIDKINLTLKQINKKMDNFDDRIKKLEYNYYAREGVHLPSTRSTNKKNN